MTDKAKARNVRTGRRYRTGRAADHYDVVVIGSGIGGLCTAALLSKLGQKVCVLEQHYTAGGYTHSYENHGYEWDVGVHYVGEVHRPWSVLRKVFDTISDGNLQWADMGKVYDQIHLGEESFDFVTGKAEFINKLAKKFPDDKAAIERYVALITRLSQLTPRFFLGLALPRTLGRLYARLRRWWLPKECFQTTREVLDGITGNEKLKAVLVGQWGDYGLPPAESAFVMHAMVAKHYLAGGAYPVGGSWAIAKHIIPVIQQSGGEVFTYAGVEQIVIDKGVARGVKLCNGDIIHAHKVVSNAGFMPTRNRLIPASSRAQFETDFQAVPLSSAHLCIYAGFKGDAVSLGLDSTNLWLYPGMDHDGQMRASRARPEADFPLIYISFPSTKDPEWQNHYPGKSTVEIVTIGSMEQFKQWLGTEWGKRGDDYDALKETISQRLLEVLFKHRPKLRAALDFYELSTPLSTQWFQWNEQGEIYGLDHTPARFKAPGLHTETPIKNLYLTGADVVTAGVGGALMAGVLTATRIVGWRGYKIMQMIKGSASASDKVPAQTAPNPG